MCIFHLGCSFTPVFFHTPGGEHQLGEAVAQGDLHRAPREARSIWDERSGTAQRGFGSGTFGDAGGDVQMTYYNYYVYLETPLV